MKADAAPTHLVHGLHSWCQATHAGRAGLGCRSRDCKAPKSALLHPTLHASRLHSAQDLALWLHLALRLHLALWLHLGLHRTEGVHAATASHSAHASLAHALVHAHASLAHALVHALSTHATWAHSAQATLVQPTPSLRLHVLVRVVHLLLGVHSQRKPKAVVKAVRDKPGLAVSRYTPREKAGEKTQGKKEVVESTRIHVEGRWLCTYAAVCARDCGRNFESSECAEWRQCYSHVALHRSSFTPSPSTPPLPHTISLHVPRTIFQWRRRAFCAPPRHVPGERFKLRCHHHQQPPHPPSSSLSCHIGVFG